MGLFDKVKAMVGGVQSKLPENLNSVDEFKAKAQDLAQQHGDQVNKVVDGIQAKLPGDRGDGIINSAQKKFDNFGGKR